MKVLYVISTLGGGGAESQLCSFAIELSRSHPKVDFEICALKDGGVFESTLEKNKIKYTVLHTKGILKSIFKLRRVIKTRKIDVVHAHMFLSDIVSRYATLFTGCKLVSTHHGLGKWKNKLHILLDKMSKHRVNRFVMVSEQSKVIRLAREKYPPEKTVVIYNGISERYLSERGRTINSNAPVIGTIARMTDNKQINLMIDAIYEIKKTYPFVRYEIVGDGENYGSLVEQTRKQGLEENVRFYGWQDDVLPVLDGWHIFALPSINEDLPVSMLECMAHGVVPVASAVGGIVTLIGKNENGILCDSGDMSTFVNAINYLVGDELTYEKMSQSCIDFISKEFLLSKTVEKTVKLYEEII